MSHSLLKIWIHGILCTKNRMPLITDTFEGQLYEHIKSKLENELDCKLRIINGFSNHLHILFLLSANFSIRDIFKNIKGETSHWINLSDFTKNKFAWQIGYGAFSVSESIVGEVEKYIANQKDHHKKISYGEEINLFIKKYSLLNNIINGAPVNR